MRITSVEMRPDSSDAVAILSFRDPSRSNPYNVKAIDGLYPDAIVPRYYGLGGSKKFYNLSLESRDITVRVQLNPRFAENESYSDLRDDLYRMIASSRTGKLQLYFKNDDDVAAAVSGFVSKFEATHFEKEQEVQITLKCDDPMLKALNPVVMTVAGHPTRVTIGDQESTAPHGFDLDMTIGATFISLIISDPTDSSWNFTISPVGGFLSLDKLHLCSDRNDKELYITRGASTIYLADTIALSSTWPIIFPGDNAFTTNHQPVVTWDNISYYPTYWGI